MAFKLLISEVRERVTAALKELGYPTIDFSVAEPPRPDLGDVYCNVGFLLAKTLRKKPQEISSTLAESIRSKIEKEESLVSSVEAHPAGYLNFQANYPVFVSHTSSLEFKRGMIDIGKNKKVLIEHTSVNPNKALHIGHVRNVVIGDCIYRILQFTNHNAYILNYVDDSGLQVADIVVGFKFAGFSMDSEKKFDHYCGDEVYVKVNELYEKDPALTEKRKHVLQQIEKQDSDIGRFARELTMRVLGEQLKTCWRLKARYDCLNFESQIIESKLWDKILQQLKSKDIVKTENDPSSKFFGCLVVKAGLQGEEKVLLRSDGTATYIAKDIPYAAWKVGLVEDPFSYYKYTTQYDNTTLLATKVDTKRGPNPGFHSADLAITVIDAKQSRLQNIITKILSVLGADPDSYVHLSYEVVALSSDTAQILGIEIGERSFAHMSGRRGVYVNADDMLDALHNTAYQAAMKRNADADKDWLESVAESIAVSAIRYSMVKQDLDKMITFDIKESLNLEGDTGPYLQYAYARACRIIEKSKEPVSNIERQLTTLLTSEHEIALVKEIAKFEVYLEDACLNLSPKTMARYAYNLAARFNAFYEKVPVLQERKPEVSRARLLLVAKFVETMKTVLCILGIDALERM